MKRSPLPPRTTPLRSRPREYGTDPALPKHGPSRALKPIPRRVKQEVADRSGFVCEICRRARAVHPHHRKLRSQGGRHEAANLLHLCSACHSTVHASPDRSYSLGYLVRGWADPAQVPVTVPAVSERAS